MTTTVTPSRALPAPTLRALRWLLPTYGTLAAWFAGVILVLWGGALVVATQFGPVTVSLAQFSRQGSTWFPFSVAITILVGYHAVHVAAGLTRRSLVAATLTASVVMAVLMGVLAVVLFAGERLLYEANGWEQRVVDNGWFPAAVDDLPAIFVWQVLLVLTSQVSGLLVAVTYLRGGPWRGTIALPLTAGPVAGLMWLLARGVELEWLTVGVRAAVTVAVALALATAYLLLVRGLQLRTPRS